MFDRKSFSFITLLLPVCFCLTWAESTCPAGYSGLEFQWRPSGHEPSADTWQWKSALWGSWCCGLHPEPLAPRPLGVEPTMTEEPDKNKTGWSVHAWSFTPVITDQKHWTMSNKPLRTAVSWQRKIFTINMFLTTSSLFGFSASSFWTGISLETKLYVVTTTS